MRHGLQGGEKRPHMSPVAGQKGRVVRVQESVDIDDPVPVRVLVGPQMLVRVFEDRRERDDEKERGERASLADPALLSERRAALLVQFNSEGGVVI